MGKEIPLEVRFHRGYKKLKSGCWEWQGTKHKNGGHGKIWKKQISLYSHRVSWLLHNGEIPKGFLVLHKCDNPPCVNPDHLFLGTYLDNFNDAKKKGRVPVGEMKPNSKLTDKDVKEIRESKENNKYLSKKYKVSPTTLRDIKRGKRWKHVNGT